MTIIKKMAALLLAAVILVIFFSLRLDSSGRHYFGIDDLVVVTLVDKARYENNWQPDWLMDVDPSKVSDKVRQANQAEFARIEADNAHHYNFAAHISLSSAIAVALDQFGIVINTTKLVRALAVFWDSASLLLLAWFTYKMLGVKAALITTLCYSVLPLAVQSSHYARPDTLLCFQALLLINLSSDLLSKKTRLQFIAVSCLTGAVMGFATATKASSLLYGVFPLATFLYLLVNKRANLITLLVSGVALLATFGISVSAYFTCVNISWNDFIESIRIIQHYYQAPKPPDIRYDPSTWGHITHAGNYLIGSLGWGWLSLSGIGAAAIYIQQRHLFWTLLLPALLLTSYYFCQSVFFDRSLLVVLPITCMLVSAGVLAVARLSSPLSNSLLIMAITFCLVWPATQLSWQLQQHIGKSLSDSRYNYQQQLLKAQREQTEVPLWLKWVDRMDIFHHALPSQHNPHPRLYVVEHFNDPQSDRYLEFLHEQGFVQVGYYRGDFAALPTSSLHIAHEAAHFYYFINPAAIAAFKQNTPAALSK